MKENKKEKKWEDMDDKEKFQYHIKQIADKKQKEKQHEHIQ